MANKTRSVGQFFVCFANQAAGSPLVDRCITRETEQPHRAGGGFLIRLPFTGNRPTRGFVVGRWRNTPDAEDAARYRWLTEDHADIETRRRSREILSRLGTMSRNAANAWIDEARANKATPQTER